jgi:hypothetical protein
MLIELGANFPDGRIRLGHESLDVTLAYLKGKDATVKNPKLAPRHLNRPEELPP